MSDDMIIGGDKPSTAESASTGEIRELIVVPFSADMTPSQMAKVLRRVANVMHAMLSNMAKYAATGNGYNVGAGNPVFQQIYTSAANADAAAATIENGQRQVLNGPMPPAPGTRGGRA